MLKVENSFNIYFYATEEHSYENEDIFELDRILLKVKQ